MFVPRWLALILIGALVSVKPVIAGGDVIQEQSIVLSTPDAFQRLGVAYGEGTRVEVDLAPREELSRALISTADGSEIDFAWTTEVAVFLAEFEQSGQEGVIVEDLLSIQNGGIRLRVFERGDGKWRIEHSWMDFEGVMRLAAATAFSRDSAASLLEHVTQARADGLFGSYPWVGGPLPEPPPIEKDETR